MPDRLYYVYILASASRVLYTGVTNNLVRRLNEHKKPAREKSVSRFTHKYRVTQLMHVEVFRDVRTAIARETQIKAWTRAKRVALIDANNPKWKDLCEEWFKPKQVPVNPAQASRPEKPEMRDSSLRSE
jgi:putative endonuclease